MSEKRPWHERWKEPPECCRTVAEFWKRLTDCWFFTPTALIAIPLFTIGAVCLLWKYYVQWPDWLAITNPETAALFGDAHGSVNALFSGLAFAGVILTILLQWRELRLQRHEIDESQRTWKESAEAQRQSHDALRQHAESAYFGGALTSICTLRDSLPEQSDRRRELSSTLEFVSECMLDRLYARLPVYGVEPSDIEAHKALLLIELGLRFGGVIPSQASGEYFKGLFSAINQKFMQFDVNDGKLDEQIDEVMTLCKLLTTNPPANEIRTTVKQVEEGLSAIRKAILLDHWKCRWEDIPGYF